MSAFKSIFKDELEEHIALRNTTSALNTRINIRVALSNFDRYLVEIGVIEKTIDEGIVNGWIKQLLEINTSRTVSVKVSILRKFLEYLRFCEISVFIPRRPKCTDSYVPYLFSEDEIEKIFHTVDTLEYVKSRPTSRYVRFMFPMLLRLLYGCGLRLSETLSLQISDVNLDDGVLWLKHTKCNKQRFVPMSKSLTEILRGYIAAMGLANNPNAFVFPAGKTDKKHFHRRAAEFVFIQILQAAGIYVKPEPHKRGQCLNCFRHLFAVKSFAQAEKNGRLIDDSVPFLSVYLGHSDMNGTEKYLKFNGDMFPEYIERFESYGDGVFSETLYEE